jgi:hypothetical protein
MKSSVILLVVLLSAPAFAQITNRPTDPPIVTAENESWYRLREPITFAGDFYYPVGATAFFDGDVMVRTGHYNGVPLYADTTLEPYSVVFVPVGRGLMQPYERVRRGDLAGTSGSRPSSFPGSNDRGFGLPAAATAPTNLPLPIGAISVYTPDGSAIATSGPPPEVVAPVATGGLVAPPLRRGRTPIRESITVDFKGSTWFATGPAMRTPADVVEVGEYAGYPVYRPKGASDDEILLPMAPGFVAPFKRKD